MHNVTEALADLFPDILPNTDDIAWRSHLRNLFIQLDIAIIHGCYQFLFCGWIRHRTINLVAKVQKIQFVNVTASASGRLFTTSEV